MRRPTAFEHLTQQCASHRWLKLDQAKRLKELEGLVVLGGESVPRDSRFSPASDHRSAMLPKRGHTDLSLHRQGGLAYAVDRRERLNQEFRLALRN